MIFTKKKGFLMKIFLKNSTFFSCSFLFLLVPSYTFSVAYDYNGNPVKPARTTFKASDNGYTLSAQKAKISTTPNQNGTLFQPFGSAGTTLLNPQIGTSTGNRLEQIFIDNNEKIICGGYSQIGFNSYFSIARFTSSGLLDTSFNSLQINSQAGTNYVPFSISGLNTPNDQCTSCISNNNKYLLGGYTPTSLGTIRFALAQFTQEGILDSTFGTGGTTYIPNAIAAAGDDFMFTLNKQTDGNIIAAGQSNFHISLARFLPSGTLDTSFGGNGTGYTFIPVFIAGGANDQCFACGIQSNGNIIVAGQSNNKMAIACFTPTGTLNTFFGGNGTGYTFITPTIAGGNNDLCYELTIQPDDKIVLAGFSQDINNRNHFALARYLSNGILDTTFGTNGTTFFPFLVAGSTSDIAYSVQLQSDGKILVSGTSNNQSTVVRLTTNSAVDSTFGSNGIVTLAIAQFRRAQSIQLTDTAIIIGGSSIFSPFFSLCKLSNIPSQATFDAVNFGNAGLVA